MQTYESIEIILIQTFVFYPLDPQARDHTITQNAFSPTARVLIVAQSQHCKSLKFKISSETQHDLLTINPYKIKKQITCFQQTMVQNIYHHSKREK